MNKVFMYTLSTCPWCRKAKQFFKVKQIPFDYVDYDLQPEDKQDKIMAEISKISPDARAFPVVMIGDQAIIGYNPEKYSELLGLKVGEPS
jgi:glutaredoxin-like protein NrdH